MPRNVKLLLTENVEALGIVGDVVNVRTGYARNFLLPRSLATEPSEELITKLAGKRAEAEKMLADQRKQREQMIGKMQGIEMSIVRSCNDQGHLYNAVTQQEIATVLNGLGYSVKPRDVRLHQVIKRIDTFDVHVKLDSDLDAHLKLHVQPDRKLDLKEGGEETVAALLQTEAAPTTKPGSFAEKPGKGAAKGEKPAAKGDKPEGTSDEKPAGKGKPEAKAEKGAKGEKPQKSDKAEKADKKKK